uniref:Uncharacterized protein n=1 Tax=Amphimedon queenslandica TaxID=400682 RepID=A0A1X7UNL9_AMPQE
MKQLLGDKAASTDPSFVRELFLQRLSAKVSMVLASTNESEDLEALATLADRVVEVATPHISNIETDQLSSEMEQLRTEIVSLKSMEKSLSHSSFPRQKSPQKHCTPSPGPPNKGSSVCWYHSRYGKKAAKCNQPCSWEQKNGQTGTNGNKCAWPYQQSHIFHNRQVLRAAFSGGYRSRSQCIASK